MLLKVITWRGVTRVITNIEDAYIHHNISYETFEQLWAQARDKFQPTEGLPVAATCLDEVGQQSAGMKNNDLTCSAGLIDYLKGPYWYREIIANHAYLCNDDGRTIAKINC